MSWFQNIFNRDRRSSLELIQSNFRAFSCLLEKNNQVLKAIADMEEKSHGDYLFDINYITTVLGEIRSGVKEIIEHMITLGGPEYEKLWDRYREIDEQINRVLPGARPAGTDSFTVDLSEADKDRAWSVGSKAAQLGEMSRMGIIVPDGFAVTGCAYRKFMDDNDLQSRIGERLSSLDIRSYQDLDSVSRDIRAMVMEAVIPREIKDAMSQSFQDLKRRSSSERFAMRSSAVGEDTLFSFAGQYETRLNVGEADLEDAYRTILASKFSPKAIYYYMSHELSETDLPMSVLCIEMVDSKRSGVIYTVDPVDAENGHMVITSIFGLGKYLVDGTLDPDVYILDKETGEILDKQVVEKPVKLVMDPAGGIREETVPDRMRNEPSLADGQVRKLWETAVSIENHYGAPQDMEFAINGDEKIYLLQARPLRVINIEELYDAPDLSGHEVLHRGGTTICPGAGAGPVFHASSSQDLSNVPRGAVLVAAHPFPGLITVMDKVSAIITESGAVASHAATIAREYRVPALAGVEGACGFEAGKPVTVDATCQMVYAGAHPDLIRARRPEDMFSDMVIFDLLEKILACISPLNLINTSDPEFSSENCKTFHDITRLCHQRAMEEMYEAAVQMKDKERKGLRLKSSIPLQVNIIYIDRDSSDLKSREWVSEDDIGSIPMEAFWRGVKQEGWPQRGRSADLKGFMSVMATGASTSARSGFSENSYAILSREYMILNLRMGYHFTTIEAMCTDEPSKNYIRMQYKEGGASLDRRMRRVRLISEVCSRMGFESSSKGDFIDSMTSYDRCEAVQEKLEKLGRLNIMTKQLDMALSSDAISQWYAEDLIKKLGLDEGGAGP